MSIYFEYLVGDADVGYIRNMLLKHSARGMQTLHDVTRLISDFAHYLFYKCQNNSNLMTLMFPSSAKS